MCSEYIPRLVLGAPDPEMRAIELLAAQCGVGTIYAMADGRRVHPGNAYRADPVEIVDWVNDFWVECTPEEESSDVDHHSQGDPGFGRSPNDFLMASSLGQVIEIFASYGVLPWRVNQPRTGDWCEAGRLLDSYGTNYLRLLSNAMRDVYGDPARGFAGAYTD